MNTFFTRDSSESAVTPVMNQYLAIKREHPDCLLFYRMGDFYEMFFEDAVQASTALDIVLTQRGRYKGIAVPMCGVPARNYELHLARLVRKGFRVAICEQLENPVEARKRGKKSIVKRAIIRIITAGTLIEDELLNSKENNYLVALADSQDTFGLAWIDVSTSDFWVQTPTLSDLGSVLTRLAPGEILISERLFQRVDLKLLLSEWKAVLNPQQASRFDGVKARQRLETLYGVRTLDGFGPFRQAEMTAAGVLIDYIALTQKGRLPRLPPPKKLRADSVMMIDSATRCNLELFQSRHHSGHKSLRAVIDCTVTSGGARLLAEYLATPLTNPGAIAERLDAVQFFKDSYEILISVRENLDRCPDIERAVSRLTIGRGVPRDLAAVRDALTKGQIIQSLIINNMQNTPLLISKSISILGKNVELVTLIRKAITAIPPVSLREGGFIADAYDSTLDELRLLREKSGRLMTALQVRYTSLTGVPALKIAHNNVLGFYVEVPARQAEKLKVHSGIFIRRQETATAIRFTTAELSALEERRRDAIEKIFSLELNLLQDLIDRTCQQAESLSAAGKEISKIDLFTSLAKIATERQYCRPIVDHSTTFEIQAGRHPVVEATMNQETPFVNNDCRLNDTQPLWLLTGANMAGKSTFLRQNALIAILAQAGSFVPAESAHIGVIDRLFSRIGAADDLARGRSTFMVEMIETATILNQSTRRSLVILDEIGRGTAILDGLAIAWASIEHLHNMVRCRGLLATHYYELASLAERLPGLACYTMRIKEWQDQMVFLYEVIAGTASRSSGLHTARLAGIPEPVLARATEALVMLESSCSYSAMIPLFKGLPMTKTTTFQTPNTELPVKKVQKSSILERILSDINIDEITPLQAIEILYSLKGKIEKSP